MTLVEKKLRMSEKRKKGYRAEGRDSTFLKLQKREYATRIRD